MREAIGLIPAWAWRPAGDPEGGCGDGRGCHRDHRGMLSRRGWPAGMRVVLRRERPHPGAPLDAVEERDGYRDQAIATNTAHASWLDIGLLVGVAGSSNIVRPASRPSNELVVSSPTAHRST